MKPITVEGTNTRLIHPFEEGRPDSERTLDMPVERCFFDTEETGEQRPGFESTWQPDVGERRALANGAPVLMRLWGAAHPPVTLRIGEPDEGAERLFTLTQTAEASTFFFSALADRMQQAENGGEAIKPEEIPAMFEKALSQVVMGKPGGSSNGNGR